MSGYNIREIKDKKEWEDFVLKQPYTIFVQSWSYGEFFKSMKENFWVFGIYNEHDKLIGGSLVVSTHAKRADFLYLPYGPILDYSNKELFQQFTKYIKEFARRSKYGFVRVSPFIDENKENRGVFKKAGYFKAPIHILAETTWMLDLQGKSEAELFRAMKKNHRNLIRRCQKAGVGVEAHTDIKAIDDFNRLHDETAKRHNFHRFSDKYISKEFEAFAKHDHSCVFHAYLPSKKLDSSGIFICYGNMAAYRHGASLMQDRKLPTSYLLLWEAIKEARRRNIKWFNFWGIAPENAHRKHPFKGITHFKKGFGGFQKDILPCHDLPISKKYPLNWLIESGRRVWRGFK